MRVFNFAAGPATLPLEVLQQAQAEMTDWKASGMSVMEVSPSQQGVHRRRPGSRSGPARAAEHPRQLQGAVPARRRHRHVPAIPMNLATADSTVDYVNTGAWSKKAIGEAKRFCKVVTSRRRVRVELTRPCPRRSRAQAHAQRRVFPLHAERNHRRRGVRLHPATSVPLVADFSSTILSRPLDVSKFGLIYAGAQKNIGPSGICVVIVRDDLIGKARPGTPSVWDFKAMADEGSMLNTPPTFGWYFAGLVFKWLKKQGGLEGHGRAQPRQGGKALRLHRGSPVSTRARWRRTRARG